MTDHGVEHVKSVIAHARDILANPMQLTGYELYLLLISIHFHDVGNILGRDQHEERIACIIEKMGNSLLLDTAEKNFITAIATAHGGYVDGDKDTIRTINMDTIYDGVQIRCKPLAAILRFADEISDDFRRTEFQNVSIPRENQIYHAYSKVLDPVSIIGETMKLHFRIPYDMTQEKMEKGDHKIYLYDDTHMIETVYRDIAIMRSTKISLPFQLTGNTKGHYRIVRNGVTIMEKKNITSKNATK